MKEIDLCVLPGSGSLRATISLPQAFRFSNEIVDRLPIGICICDHEGVQYNLCGAELWVQAPDLSARQFRFCGASQVYRPNGQLLSELPMAEVLRTGRSLRDREVVFERSDGSRVSVLCNVDSFIRRERSADRRDELFSGRHRARERAQEGGRKPESAGR